MAEDEILVHGSKLNIVEKCRDRLQRLFGVTSETTFIALQDGGPCKITVHATDSSPQESLEKAKRYLDAVIGDSSHVSRKHINLPQQDIDKLIRHHDLIESLTQVSVTFESKGSLSIQGTSESINTAEDYIHKVLARIEVSNKARDSFSSLTVSCGNNDSFVDSGLLSPSVQESCRSDEAVTDTTGSESSSQSGASRFDGGLVSRGAAPDMPRSPSVILPADTCSSSGSSSRSMSPTSDIMRNPDYNAKLEKAVKLGYTEEQLIAVLKKLGINADQNQVLSEMIKLGTTAKVSQEKIIGEIKTVSVDEGFIEKRKGEVSEDVSNLRPIVIDGSNVAMSYGNGVFSCQGIQLAVRWFQERGHNDITVFVPQWRKETSRQDAPITGQEILQQLEKEGIMSFTPSRRVDGRRVVCYDDRFILQLAAKVDGIVVSNDNYRDLVNERAEFKKVVEERLLMYTFASNRFMPPDDPLGRRGPTLDNFLRKEPTVPEPLPPECPYGKKCTYGNKCRYYHPERKQQPHQSITDKLREQAKLKMQEREQRQLESVGCVEKPTKEPVRKPAKKALTRTQSVFPEGLPDGMVMPTKMTASGGPSRQSQASHDYNDKLNMARKKYERAEINRLALSSEGSESSYSHIGRQASSFDYTQQDNQLKVPPSQPNEGYVSGHLFLAKKLSDEAQDTTFFHSGGRLSPGPQRGSPLPRQSSPQPQRSHLTSMGLSDLQNPVSLDPVSGKLHRSPHHTPQPSRTCYSGPSMYMRQETPVAAGALDYVGQCRSFPLQQSDYPTHQRHGNHGPYASKPDEMHGMMHHYPNSAGQHLLNPVGYNMHSSTSEPQLNAVGGAGPGDHGTENRHGFPRSSSQQLSPYNMPFAQNKGYSYHGWSDGTSEVSIPRLSSLQNVYDHDQYSPAGQERSKAYGNGGQMSQHPSFPASPHAMQNPPSQQHNMSQHHKMSFPPMPHQQHMLNPQMTPQQEHHPQQQHMSMPQMSPQHQLHPHQQQQHMSMPQMTSQQDHQHMLTMAKTPQQQEQHQPSHPRLDAPIAVSDPRYSTFYHLCGLFPQTKVMAVMNKYPHENDPRMLCQYIMSLEKF